MGKIAVDVKKELCGECSMALRRFIGKMKGVNSIDVENEKVVIDFDDLKISKEDLFRITRDSIEKLGYKVES
ncbi:MAG: heavy-metal-associated domain-containing protein [Nitrospirota bacterium]